MGFEGVVLAVGRRTGDGVSLLGTSAAVGPRHLVTAFHVVGQDDSELVVIMPRQPFGDYQDTTDTSVNFVPTKLSEADPLRDLAILEIPQGSELRFSYEVGSTDAAPPGERVVAMGFPHANHGRLVLTQQATSVGARILNERHGVTSKQIVLNTQTTHGQSGSPVFTADGRQLVAVILGSYAPGGGGGISLGGIDPQTLHQTTHAVSSEYVASMR